MKSDELLRRVAPRLAQLRWPVVYVGGATTYLYITDPAAATPTATQDVDVVVDVRTPVTYEVDLRDALRQLGAREDTTEGAPIGRWMVNGIAVDLIPSDRTVLGFSNRWYPAALKHSVTADLGGAVTIRHITAPYFLATKAEAFQSRGRGDFLTSKDIEDFIAVVDGRPTLVEEVRASAGDVRQYLREVATTWLAQDAFVYAVEGYLQGEGPRVTVVLGRMSELAK